MSETTEAETPEAETPEAETDAASALIDALAQGGEFVDTGSFRLDHAHARKKLRAHGLTLRNIYSCLLVEIAVLVGAERIVFEVESNLLEVRFAGAGFETSELECLSEALFVELPAATDEASAVERRRRRALQLLSLVVQATIGLGATRIELRSPPATRALKIDVDTSADNKEDNERWAMSAQELSTTLNIVRIRFPMHLRIAGLPGIQELRRLCAWSNFPIYLDNERVSHGHDAAFLNVDEEQVSLIDPVPILDEDGETIGLATILQFTIYKKAQLHVLCNGWYIEQLSVPTSLTGFEAIVEVDLPRDIGQIKFLRKDAFMAMCAAVDRCAKQLEDLGVTGKPYDFEHARESKKKKEASQDAVSSRVILAGIAILITLYLFIAGSPLAALIGFLVSGFLVVATVLMFKNQQTEQRERHVLTRDQTEKSRNRR
ncbi:hypothetical protein G6O69_23780 [Pseudenhygromyxa sp. WMMC2535]|uniref:hypothetical protein n=1 Tax=Pseudenhygromyxa sp. WMMC2535 TaxID=2712867 RepID=UPI00155283DE|nr:hypothetical protein [Pseudenhygromyxa sp. WMMC2535]NVB40880.1 hypothetical protein [Pseudenhygromyxa sp. WMMC2535]